MFTARVLPGRAPFSVHAQCRGVAGARPKDNVSHKTHDTRSDSTTRHRPAASNIPTKPVPVQQVLRKFYKSVHPDMFAQDAVKKKTNAESFGLLMNYLDVIKDHKSTRNLSPEDVSKFTLKFYTKEMEEPISLEVNPPLLDSQQQQKEIHLRRTLIDLFTLCKFAHEPFEVSGFGASSVEERYAAPGELSLISYIKLAAPRVFSKVQKKSNLDKAKEETMQNQLTSLSNQIARRYKLGKLSFAVRDHMFMPILDRLIVRLSLVQKLEKALEEAKDIVLSGVSIVISNKKSGTDVSANLVLNHLEEASDWVSHLESYRRERAEEMAGKIKAQTELEKSLAQLLGVSSWTCDPDVSGNLMYKSWLGTTISTIKRENWNLPSNVKELKIRVTKNFTAEAQPANFLLLLPLTTTPSELKSLILSNSKELLESAKALQSNMESIKTACGLKELSTLPYPEINDEQLNECVNRLWKHQAMLKPHIEGLHLMISNDYGYNLESGIIAIRWDYMIDR